MINSKKCTSAKFATAFAVKSLALSGLMISMRQGFSASFAVTQAYAGTSGRFADKVVKLGPAQLQSPSMESRLPEYSWTSIAAACSLLAFFGVQKEGRQKLCCGSSASHRSPLLRSSRVVATAVAGDSLELGNGRRATVLSNRAELVSAIAKEVAGAARHSIAEKGDFSICVPGSLGPADGVEAKGTALLSEALASLASETDLNFGKWHVFFAGERMDKQESYTLAKELWLDKLSEIPADQVHPVEGGMPAEPAAATYTANICMQDESVMVDSPEGLPAVDLLLLDVGSDGTIGRLRPSSPEVASAGNGQVVLFIEDIGKEAVAVSLDFMNAARKAV
eukprot:TRINITY_DN19556_c0_g1_i3.p1 TRINITY_DN19556_c0_g1~~TRINITY_DN19556_c0_g1_i3.p1  ORF type:complete len:337 (-),score=76.77 TRINITY_DN19556_c0_g1_i3:144-1154(-)